MNALTGVALRFKYNSKESVMASKKALEALEIHSGDEVESLYTTLSGTMGSMADYIDEGKESVRKLTAMQHNVIVTMADIIESRDGSTGGHVKRTSKYVELIVNDLKLNGYFKQILTKDYIDNIVKAAPMHDIGKISIPDSILQKPGKLTDEEFDIMKKHTIYGAQLVRKSLSKLGDSQYIDIVYDTVLYHHEKWNGKGYPMGLSGEAIPLCARIMAVADVFDAVSAKRCYRDAMPLEECYSIIENGRGVDFDPDIVDAFMADRNEIEEILYNNSN